MCFTLSVPSVVRISILSCFVAISGQTQDSQREAIRLKTDLVVLDAQVLDKKTSRLVGNLNGSDFLLFEDGVRQDITHFSIDKLPLSIVLLLDVSPSVRPFIDQISAGALQAMERLKPDDEVAVMVFAGTPKLIQDFTRDRELVVEQIRRISEVRGIRKGTNIVRALDEAAKAMMAVKSANGRRVIVTVTDNESYVRRGGSGTTTKQTLDNLFESGSVVCGLIVRGLIAKVQSGLHWSPLNLALFRSYKVDPFAEQTGGELMPSSKPEVDKKLGELFEHLRTRYSLGFNSTNTNYDGKFRKIALKLSPELQKQNPELVVRTRQGYYAKPTGSSSEAK